MIMRKLFGAPVMCLLVALSGSIASTLAQNQTSAAPQAERKENQDDQTNLDTQLYLIVGTNQEVAEPKLSAALDGVIKQLRSSLPFKNYRLAATLVNRVKNEGRLNVRWLGGPFAVAASSSVTPSFSEFKVHSVRLLRDSAGQLIVQMSNFSFGARIPVQTSTVAANGSAIPVINYENTGLDTDISMREGEPVIVGTLNIGPSGDAIILVVAAKRTLK